MAGRFLPRTCMLHEEIAIVLIPMTLECRCLIIARIIIFSSESA